MPLVLAGAFALAALAIGMPLVAVAGHLAVGVAVLAAGFCLFRLGLMGGGDAKLMAASVLWFGLGPPALAYLVETSLLGGVLTLGLLALRGSVLAPLMSCKPALSHLVDPRAGVPYRYRLGDRRIACLSELTPGGVGDRPDGAAVGTPNTTPTRSFNSAYLRLRVNKLLTLS